VLWERTLPNKVCSLESGVRLGLPKRRYLAQCRKDSQSGNHFSSKVISGTRVALSYGIRAMPGVLLPNKNTTNLRFPASAERKCTQPIICKKEIHEQLIRVRLPDSPYRNRHGYGRDSPDAASADSFRRPLDGSYLRRCNPVSLFAREQPSRIPTPHCTWRLDREFL